MVVKPGRLALDIRLPGRATTPAIMSKSRPTEAAHSMLPLPAVQVTTAPIAGRFHQATQHQQHIKSRLRILAILLFTTIAIHILRYILQIILRLPLVLT